MMKKRKIAVVQNALRTYFCSMYLCFPERKILQFLQNKKPTTKIVFVLGTREKKKKTTKKNSIVFLFFSRAFKSKNGLVLFSLSLIQLSFKRPTVNLKPVFRVPSFLQLFRDLGALSRPNQLIHYLHYEREKTTFIIVVII